MAIENGVPIKSIAARLGDSVEMVNKIYAHDTLKMQKQTVEVFDNLGRKYINADRFADRLGYFKKKTTNRAGWWHVVDNTIHIIGELERNDIHYQIDSSIYYSFSQIFF